MWHKFTEYIPVLGKVVLCCGERGGMFIGKIVQMELTHDGKLYVNALNERTGRYAKNWMYLPDKPKF